MDKIEDLRNRIRELNVELTRLEAMPDPAQMPLGTVLMWNRKFDVRSTASSLAPVIATGEFVFVAVKTPISFTGETRDGAGWHITGSNGQERYTDDEIREALADSRTSNRRRVESWEPFGPWGETRENPFPVLDDEFGPHDGSGA